MCLEALVKDKSARARRYVVTADLPEHFYSRAGYSSYLHKGDFIHTESRYVLGEADVIDGQEARLKELRLAQAEEQRLATEAHQRKVETEIEPRDVAIISTLSEMGVQAETNRAPSWNRYGVIDGKVSR